MKILLTIGVIIGLIAYLVGYYGEGERSVKTMIGGIFIVGLGFLALLLNII